jgi:phthalate 4,5-cis-dihydrodiol dehydrogenase
MGETLSVAVIGVGVIGQEHMQVIDAADELRLVAVMDIDSDHARAAAEQFKATAHTTLQDLLEDPEVEAVHVCTPHTQHVEPVVAAAEAGKHVLVEKPMALTLHDCDRMIEACDTADRILMVGQSLRCDPAHLKVKELIAAETIGDVGHIMMRWYDHFDPTQPENPYGEWYLDPALGGNCLLHTFGPHVFDILPWILDSAVVRVYAQGSASTELYRGQKDSFSTTMTHENGTISLLSERGQPYRCIRPPLHRQHGIDPPGRPHRHRQWRTARNGLPHRRESSQ